MQLQVQAEETQSITVDGFDIEGYDNKSSTLYSDIDIVTLI